MAAFATARGPAAAGAGAAAPAHAAWAAIIAAAPDKYARLDKYFAGLTDEDTRRLVGDDLVDDAGPADKPRMRLFVEELAAAGGLYNAAVEAMKPGAGIGADCVAPREGVVCLRLRGRVYGRWMAALAAKSDALVLSAHDDVVSKIRPALLASRAAGTISAAGGGRTPGLPRLVLDCRGCDFGDADLPDLVAILGALEDDIADVTLVLQQNRFLGESADFWTTVRSDLLWRGKLKWLDLSANPATSVTGKEQLSEVRAAVKSKLIFMPPKAPEMAWDMMGVPVEERAALKDSHATYYRAVLGV